MQTLKGVYESAFGLFRPSETHVPKQLDKVGLHPSVGLNISCNMYTTMNDANIFAYTLTMAFRWAQWRSHTNV